MWKIWVRNRLDRDKLFCYEISCRFLSFSLVVGRKRLLHAPFIAWDCIWFLVFGTENTREQQMGSNISRKIIFKSRIHFCMLMKMLLMAPGLISYLIFCLFRAARFQRMPRSYSKCSFKWPVKQHRDKNR